MLKLLRLCSALALSMTAIGTATASGVPDAMNCSVTVTYALSGVPRLAYTKDFTVTTATRFSDDFSTATRIRWFDASLALDNGTPVVAMHFDADVSPFNAVSFDASLRVKDERHGETSSGSNSFYSSVPGAAGAHKTDYALTCWRAD